MAARRLVGLAALAALTSTARAQAPSPPTSCNALTSDQQLTGAAGISTVVSAVGYTANSDCKWLLQCGAGESVRMSFTDFNMHEWSARTALFFFAAGCRASAPVASSCPTELPARRGRAPCPAAARAVRLTMRSAACAICRNDLLFVTDGATSSSVGLATLTGHQTSQSAPGSTVFTSRGPELLINLWTQHTVYDGGFVASFECFQSGTPVTASTATPAEWHQDVPTGTSPPYSETALQWVDHGQHNVISLGGQNELGETHMKMYVSKLGDEFKWGRLPSLSVSSPPPRTEFTSCIIDMEVMAAGEETPKMIIMHGGVDQQGKLYGDLWGFDLQSFVRPASCRLLAGPYSPCPTSTSSG
jgi:hypothetical protein